jgi:hypothetical protein
MIEESSQRGSASCPKDGRWRSMRKELSASGVANGVATYAKEMF